MGNKFAITRLLVDIPGIIIMPYLLNLFLSKGEIKKLYEEVEKIDKKVRLLIEDLTFFIA